jgi:hypothetical protein
MKIKLIIYLRLSLIPLLIVLILFQRSLGQEKWQRLNITPEPTVCYASGKVEKNFIPPPEQVQYRLKSGATKKCDIIVTYTSFPDSAKKAFEYAVSIWEQLLESDVPIYVTALWRNLDANTLANCAPANYYRNMNEFYYKDRFYPVAIAEKISGQQITGSSSPDLTATFNRTISWYFGTDGNTPSDKYDFVSTVLHELTHGLGFTGFFYVETTSGGYDSPPTVFDQFLTNSSKQNLINTELFTNPSDKIYKALTSNSLFFRSPAVLYNNGSAAARLYAPFTWSNGSSVYHLNDATYATGNINSLMTHATGLGEAIHDPGPITMGILADIGWKNMTIKHDTLKDIEAITDPVAIEAFIISDYALDFSSLFVYYSLDSFKSKDSVLMKAEEKPSYFKALLPVSSFTGTISYYISATDEKFRTFTNPFNAPLNFFKLRVGPDLVKPFITHQPKDFILNRAPSLNIFSLVDDNIGVDSVWVEYLLNNREVETVGLKHDSTTSYSVKISLAGWDLNEGDSISYRVVARDVSSNHNISFLPTKGHYVVKIKQSMAPVINYLNNFNGNNDDFIGSDFQIKTVSGFIDGALHSQHPYPSPGTDNMFFNFITLLKYPVILQENAQMDFDEIVLVEPGEPGTVFGDPEFFDYVIVEGSKDYGNTWLPLANGYDSRANQTWETEYNNGINDSGSSETVGTKEMFIKRNINILENRNFAVGDTIFIRFRLYSDPYANGWGWVIDNLRIQMLLSANELNSVSPGEFRIYPNPFNETFMVEFNSKSSFHNVTISVFDSFGEMILNESVQNSYLGFRKEINLRIYPPGMYYIQVIGDGKPILSRKIIKQ